MTLRFANPPIAGALLAAILLAACQASPPQVPQVEASDHWRVVERAGHVGILSPRVDRRVPAVEGAVVERGAVLTTGRASQLILAGRGVQVTLGPGSRIVLPAGPNRAGVQHEQGSGRYRVNLARNDSLVIATPSGSAESGRGVVDVEVRGRPGRTVFSVGAGEARIATGDGAQAVALRPGQSAHLPGAGARIALQMAPGGPLQPMVPEVVPAVSQTSGDVEGVGVSKARDREVTAGPPGARREAHAHSVAALRRAPFQGREALPRPGGPTEPGPEEGAAEVPPKSEVAAAAPATTPADRSATETRDGAVAAAASDGDDGPAEARQTFVDRILLPARFDAPDASPDGIAKDGDGPNADETSETSSEAHPTAGGFDQMTRGLLEGLGDARGAARRAP